MKPSRSLSLWIGMSSAALLAGAFVPLPDYLPWRAGTTLDWYQSEARFMGPAMTWAPALLGIVALTLVTLFPPSRTRRILAVVALAPPGAYTLLGLTAPRYSETLLLCQLMVGAALIAAGNRVARRFPDPRLPAVLAWIGGAQVVLGFLLWREWGFDRSLLYELGYDLLTYSWAVAAFAFAVLGYGLLAASILPYRRPASIRRRVLSWLGCLLLLGFPVVLCQHTLIFRDSALYLKFWLLATGHTILLAASVAGWLEARSEGAGQNA